VIRSAVAAALVLIASPAFAAPDELCPHLAKFERQAAHAGRPQWIEVYWYFDRAAIFSVACKHQKMGSGKELCGWLPSHMSWEFAGILPKRINGCYGLSGDQFGVGKFPSETIQFRSKAGNTLLMQTATVPDNLPWLRLAVLGRGRKSALPPPAPYREDRH